MARKRKAEAEAINNGKENQALDAISAPQPPSKRIRVADPTQQSSSQIIVPSSPGSPGGSVPAPRQSPSCKSRPGGIADTVGSAFSLTLPPTAGQAAVAHSDFPCTGDIIVPSSSESPSGTVSIPTQSPSCESRPGSIADTVGSAFSLTMPPAAGQVAMAHSDFPCTGNIVGLESLGDQSLCTFSTGVLGDSVLGLMG
jgi:hypothetical protein